MPNETRFGKGFSPIRFLKVFSIYTLVLLLLILLVESLMAFFSFHRIHGEENKHEVEYVRRLSPPFFDGFVTQGKQFRLVTNKDGLILGPDQYGERDSLSNCDILFMGGSTTMCRFVDDSLRFPYRTSTILSETLGMPVRTLNAGFMGNHTFHSICNLVYTGLSYKPKIVVFMHNINDLAILSRTGSYFKDLRPLTKLRTMEKSSFVHYFLFKYLPNRSEGIRSLSGRMQSGFNTPPFAPLDEFKGYRSIHVEEKVIMEEYSKALRTFHGICIENGISLVLMTEANLFDRDNTDSSKYFPHKDVVTKQLNGRVPTYNRINQTIRDYAKKNSLTCIDLDRGIPHNSTYLYDEVHMNSAGSSLAAQLIVEGILRDRALLAGIGK